LRFDDAGGAPVLGGRRDALVTQAGRLVAFDLRRGRVAWERRAGFAGTPAVANGVVYALDGGILVALDESDGRELWRWTPPTIIDSNVIATVDHVFAATRTTTYAPRRRQRQVAWS